MRLEMDNGHAKLIDFGTKISRLDSNLVANNLLAQ